MASCSQPHLELKDMELKEMELKEQTLNVNAGN